VRLGAGAPETATRKDQVKPRKVKRVVVQLKPEHIALIKEALKGREGELRAPEDKRLREEVLKALEGRAVL
jgi:hypothetical protein